MIAAETIGKIDSTNLLLLKPFFFFQYEGRVLQIAYDDNLQLRGLSQPEQGCVASSLAIFV